MSVTYYLHTPLPDGSNEWRAVSRLARLIHRHFGREPDPYALVFNIDPQEKIINADGKKLTQLDALLIGPHRAIAFEFKNCYESIRAESLDDPWYSGDHVLFSGGAKNPYLQVQFARYVWLNYLVEKCARYFKESRSEWRKRWDHLSNFVVFAPYLHPDSSLTPLLSAYKWLTVCGLNDVSENVFRTRFPDFALPSETVKAIVENVLRASVWEDLARVRDEQIGNLELFEPNRTLIRVPLYRYDEVSIGRSTTQLVKVDNRFLRVSGAHASLEVQDGRVKLVDVGSKNGTYVRVNGRYIKVPPDYALAENEWALLGSSNLQGAVRISYTLHNSGTIKTADTKTIYGTLETQV